MKTNLVFLLILTALASWNEINAGNSSSGGGFVYETSLNPWFLENTKSVGFCVEVDTQNFSLSQPTIEKLVMEAINHWKEVFKKNQYKIQAAGEFSPFGRAKIATQRFIKEDCKPSTELRFQFGVLSQVQRRDYIKTPNRVVAQAIRTDYNLTKLKGKGFIYIAPDNGPLKPTNVNIDKQPWLFYRGIILKRVLLHELGHVFGLSHSGSAFELMGEAHPEFIVLESTIQDLGKNSEKDVVDFLGRIDILGFNFPYSKEFCHRSANIDIDSSNVFDRFFGIPRDAECRKIVFRSSRIEVYSSNDRDKTYKLVGKMRQNSPNFFTKVISRVKLSKEQIVFPKLPRLAEATGYVDSVSEISRIVFNGKYFSVDGKRKGGLKATLLPNQFVELEVVWNNQIVQLLDHGG